MRLITDSCSQNAQNKGMNIPLAVMLTVSLLFSMVSLPVAACNEYH